MDIRKVKKLIELLEESGIAEIEIKEGEESVRISRMSSGAIAAQPAVYAPPPIPAAVAAAVAAAPAAAPAASTPVSVDHVVPAPMVGTYYSAPAPGAKPFVQIGDEVKVGHSASELESVVDVVAFGLSNTAGAVEATEKVSANVRKVLGIVDFIGSVDDLKKSLEAAEVTLSGVRESLLTSGQSLVDAGPALHETVVALRAVPDQIDAALADAADARKRLDGQVWLWRLAVVTGALAVIGGLWGVRQNAIRVDRLLAAVSTPTG